MLKIRVHIAILCFLISGIAESQTPTVQDCLGAIPICQNTYSTTTSYFGMGNYPNEVNLNNCLYLGGESNSVWYVFTVQSPGIFRFVLTPNSSGDDYDWAVFNLTNYSCSNIYSNSSMMVSCNASGYTGATGISTPMGGSGNSNGPNWTNKFNQDLPVQAGQTYVLMISNWSNGTPGYTINFGTSTAQIFDNVPPSINQITSTINCGASSLTFNFSENILCNTLSTCDLSLTGPGGPYTITGINGAACNVGGKQEKTFTINFSPPITTGGTFNLNLNANACGSVTDLCNNVAPSGSLPFNVNLVSVTTSATVASCATPNGTATANASGGTGGGYTYLWSTSPPQTTSTATNLYSGTYTVTVYNGACSAVGTAVVGTTSNMTATVNNIVNATCNKPNGSANVSIVGGTLPLSYQWGTTPVQTTPAVTGLYPGTYTVTVTDANSCTVTASAVISQLAPPPSLAITGTDILCYGNSTGSVDLNITGGTSPFTYLWSNGASTQNLNGISSGNYAVTVTDGVNCSVTGAITITQPSAPLTGNIIPVHILCNGNSSGSADLTVSGGTPPYSYLWSNGATTQDLLNLAAGIYNVTVYDNNNCSIYQSVTINEPLPLVNNFSATNALCFGSNTGSAVAVISGGTQPYTYTWLPSGTAGNVSNVNNLFAGGYTLQVTDQNGCSVDTTFIIGEPQLLTYTYSVNNVNCFGGNDGSIDIIASGGTAPFAYTWNPSVSAGSSAVNLTSGIYSVTIADHNGCDTTLTVNISQPQQLVLTTTGDDTVCIDGQVTFGATATGGVSPYLYTWDNGLGTGDSFTIIAVTTTTYNVSVTDSNNCQAGPSSLNIFVRDPLLLGVTASPGTICAGNQSFLTANVTGGEAPYSFVWSNSSLASQSINVSPVITTTYNVTVTDACGSPYASSSVSVVVNPSPIVDFYAGPLNGCAPLNVNFTDASTPSIQSWYWEFDDPASGFLNTSTQQNPVHLFNNPGSYSVNLIVVTQDGCQGEFINNNMIDVYPKPVASFIATPNPASSVAPTVVFYNQSLGASQWLWNFGDAGSASNTSVALSPSHTFSGPGSYYVWLIVESEYGCIDSSSSIVSVNQEFTFWVPSAFSPNEDGVNDIFLPKGININPDTYKMFIYDRWGKEIFMSEDINHGWDGLMNNLNEAPQGVYVWIIDFEEINGMAHSYKGRVTLIK